MTREEFEAQYGRLPKNAVYLDLDETKVIDEELHGWLDSQIKTKTLEEFDAMIRSAELNIERFEQQAAGERERREQLRDIRNRRKQLGD